MPLVTVTMRMTTMVVRLAARVAPADPIRPLGPVLALPDRNARFDLVDEPPARGERLAPMRCARGAHDGRVAHAERADTVNDGDPHARNVALDFLGDTAHLGHGHGRVGLVFEERHGASVRFIPDDPDKNVDAARARSRDGRDDGSEVDRMLDESDARGAFEHPADASTAVRTEKMHYARRVRVSLPVLVESAPSVERAEPRAVRLSITDRCDLACVYCRPHRRDGYLPAERRIDARYWATLVEGLAKRGVRRVRLTGGEPLLHPGVVDIARAISSVDGIEDLAITTNGTQLRELAGPLRDAGVRRLNLSIDSLDAKRFFRLSRGGRLQDVIAGLHAARAAGFELKTNTVVIGPDNDDLRNDDELVALAEFAFQNNATPRFLELMTVGEGARLKSRLVAYPAIRAALSSLLVDEGAEREADRGPAIYARTRNGRRIGFITGTSDTFCSGCDRLRVSSDGRLRPCLATNDAVDVSHAIKHGDVDAIAEGLDAAWAIKPGDDWGGCTESTAASVDMRATGG